MNLRDLTEEQLIEESISNVSAFAELYRRYVKKIYNFFYYRTFQIEESEDLQVKRLRECWRISRSLE